MAKVSHKRIIQPPGVTKLCVETCQSTVQNIVIESEEISTLKQASSSKSFKNKYKSQLKMQLVDDESRSKKNTATTVE